MRQRTSNPLRCFCRRTPLLATYGLDENGEVYIHVKVYKSHRIYGEVVITKGIVKLHCRECMRWHTIRIVGKEARLVESPAPANIESSSQPDHD